ncbi:hypothetical protein UNDYM_4426 [Undibacterium sp. YM2]|uniref:hypothetical protein n=1 Tax=Undibacterium sp. YM2 TaxID=2058625 RepID=UPI001331F57C|nr:hypothetical protein [Undibacterium sp. YM2]BBB68679.1 hypothetical protein UNDYM_4426 [Undibacterium sp. YM2]
MTTATPAAHAFAALPPGLFRTTALSATHGARPALGFKTGITSTLSYPNNTENQGLAVAADGSVWTLTSDSVSQLDRSTGAMVKICDYALHNKSMFGFPQHLAPVNFQHAFFIRSKDRHPVIMEFHKNIITDPGSVRMLPALEDNDLPSAITATSDGNMWVRGRSGHVWQYTNNVWKKIATPEGTSILQISAGAADFLLALAKQNGYNTVLRLQDGAWVTHNKLPHVSINWIGACEDKEYWCTSASLQTEGDLYLIRDGAVVQSFALGKMAVGFTAASWRSCYFFSVEKMSFQHASIGVIDQPAQDWPTMTTKQKQIYDDMSAKLGITNINGLRSQYTNINATFSIWTGNLSNMVRPENFTQEDWDIVKYQLLNELEYVQGMTTLSSNVGTLNGIMNNIYTNTYNKVVKMMGLPDKAADHPKTVIELVLHILVDKLEGEIISKAKAVVNAEAVDISVACLRYAMDELNKKHKLPDGNHALHIACAELAGTLNEMLVEAENARAKFQEAVLKDWGRLSACGQAIRSGVWFWAPGTTYEKIKDADKAISLNFYQILMPVKWKIVRCQGIQSIRLPTYPYMHHVPRYALMCKVLEGQGNSIYWWHACMEVGAAVIQQSEGPFPDQNLLEAIFALDTTPLDFFTGTRGWKLNVANVPGYSDPEPAAQWKPYVNLPGPAG